MGEGFTVAVLAAWLTAVGLQHRNLNKSRETYQELVRQYESQMASWQESFCCHRCDLVFVPGEPDTVPVPGVLSVVLRDVGRNKIEVIKAVRKVTGLGLKEAKDLVESAPTTVLHDVGAADANRAAARLIEAGAIADTNQRLDASGPIGNVLK